MNRQNRVEANLVVFVDDEIDLCGERRIRVHQCAAKTLELTAARSQPQIELMSRTGEALDQRVGTKTRLSDLFAQVVERWHEKSGRRDRIFDIGSVLENRHQGERSMELARHLEGAVTWIEAAPLVGTVRG